MRPFIIYSIAFAFVLGNARAQSENGLQTVASPYPASATVEKLEAAIKTRGMKVFTRIDHAAAAAEAGLSMPPATVVVFGNPKGGTPNFLKAPTLAIDLPLRALVWQDQTGRTFVTWNSGEYVVGTLFERHGLKLPQQAAGEQQGLLAGIMHDTIK